MDKYIFYDYETTGLDVNNDNPIEIGAIDNFGKKFQCYVKISTELSPEVSKITGYTKELLENKGYSLNVAFGMFKNYIFSGRYKNIFMIAHNGTKFDHLITERLFKSYFPDNKFYILYLDTYPLCKLCFPNCKNYKLSNLCKEICDYESKVVHNALYDAILVEKLFNKLFILQ